MRAWTWLVSSAHLSRVCGRSFQTECASHELALRCYVDIKFSNRHTNSDDPLRRLPLPPFFAFLALFDAGSRLRASLSLTAQSLWSGSSLFGGAIIPVFRLG